MAAYKHGRHEWNIWLKKFACNVHVNVLAMQDRRTNMTDYIDPYVTHNYGSKTEQPHRDEDTGKEECG